MWRASRSAKIEIFFAKFNCKHLVTTCFSKTEASAMLRKILSHKIHAIHSYLSMKLLRNVTSTCYTKEKRPRLASCYARLNSGRY